MSLSSGALNERFGMLPKIISRVFKAVGEKDIPAFTTPLPGM